MSRTEEEALADLRRSVDERELRASLQALNLMSAERRPGLINRRYGKLSSTILHIAAFRAMDSHHSTSQIIAALLEAGADPTVEDAHGRRPLMVAVTDGHIQAIKVCLHMFLSPPRPGKWR